MSDLVVKDPFASIANVLIAGDLSKLSDEQRVTYNNKVCESLGMNPLTRPFEFMAFQGKMVMYAKRDATDQLRRIHNVSVMITSRERMGDVYVVTAQARLPSGRTDESTGVVTLGRLSGDALANAYMKAETKAKRRVTLSICGLGLLDETEAETLPGARVVKESGYKTVDLPESRETSLRAEQDSGPSQRMLSKPEPAQPPLARDPDPKPDDGPDLDEALGNKTGGEYRIIHGKYTGKLIKELSESDLKRIVDWIEVKQSENNTGRLEPAVEALYQNAIIYLSEGMSDAQ